LIFLAMLLKGIVKSYAVRQKSSKLGISVLDLVDKTHISDGRAEIRRVPVTFLEESPYATVLKTGSL
jgi:hypothetical protein